MKQIVFISGKGGTGKSTIVASLSLLVQGKMLADCDVDAPDLHLLLKGEPVLRQEYSGSNIARIDPERCTSCGACLRICRFDAIGPGPTIHRMKCEGCGACLIVCPTNAIDLVPVRTGETFVTRTDRGTFSHARLDVGADGSGKLVTEVRRNLTAFGKGEDWVLIDGSPGIGCVVVASITGADAVVAVTEPTPSGLYDLERVLSVAAHFLVPAFVCVNKFDLNPDYERRIEEACRGRSVPVIGRIPFDPAVVEALQQGLTPVEADLDAVVDEIRSLWNRLVDHIAPARKEGE